MKRVTIIFTISFILNFIWENIHSLLYSHYIGGEITEFILLRATLGDAVMISIFSLPFIFLPTFKNNYWIMIVIGVIVAVSIEWAAISVGRWSYNELMPIVPILNVGLTPTIQLGILGYLSLRIQDIIYKWIYT